MTDEASAGARVPHRSSLPLLFRYSTFAILSPPSSFILAPSLRRFVATWLRRFPTSLRPNVPVPRSPLPHQDVDFVDIGYWVHSFRNQATWDLLRRSPKDS